MYGCRAIDIIFFIVQNSVGGSFGKIRIQIYFLTGQCFRKANITPTTSNKNSSLSGKTILRYLIREYNKETS